MNTPVLFLDVDGVLNAFPRGTPPAGFIKGNATPFDTTGVYSTPQYFQITYNPEIIARLLELHTSEQLTIIWATTWGRAANWSLSELLDLPGFDVLADPEEQPYRSMGWHEWWKAYAVRQFMHENPSCKIIWIDDDINAQRNNIHDILLQDNVLAISPPEHRGLSHAHIDLIEAFLKSDVHSSVDSVK